MASTSASSIQKSFKYDVFLSFRGEDTRKTFVDHLYHALHQKGIVTYKDDERIKKGERISDQLIRSIENSRIYIIIFSKNYASSSWCLGELVKIMECQKMIEHTAYPIFYDVEPTEVRNQIGAVGKAFAKHVRGSWNSVLPLNRLCSITSSCTRSSSLTRYTRLVDLQEEEDIVRWRNAMKEAAGLAGLELKNTVDGHEAKFIKKIIEVISPKLHFINLIVDENLVGLQTRVRNVVSSLEIDSDDVQIIGIKGMGGSGKTTLARAIYDHISIWFEGKSFVENVREGSKGSGLKELQKQVLQDVLNDQSIVVRSVYEGKNQMKKIMGDRKILVVLDDVDDIGQLEALAGEPNWFKSGSKIIITTRDEHVLVAHGVHTNDIHDVSLLSHGEAICLFNRYAFKRSIPIQGYAEVSDQVVHYAAGLPLTIKVLGSFLCGRPVREWVDALERLKTIPLKETLKKLELSYNGLENDQKEIFLEVACILKGEKRKKAIQILESCGYHAELGLRVLEQKSLITISDAEELLLHDHIQEMGMNIVRRLHPEEPNRHSRLWIKEEIENVLVNQSVLNKLKFLDLKNSDLTTFDLGMTPNLENLYLIECDKFIDLKIPIECHKMKFLHLSYSKLRNLNLGMIPNLEGLELIKCKDFEELYMPVENIKLKLLTVRFSRLRNLNLGMTPNLEELELMRCDKFVELHIPFELPKLKLLTASFSKLSNLNLRMTPNLEKLDLMECVKFVELHMPIKLPNLKLLKLNSSKLSNLNLGITPNLEEVYLLGCHKVVKLHMPSELPKLKILNLNGSKVSNLNLGMTPNLERLDLGSCNDLEELHMPAECPKLKFLNLNGSKLWTLNLGLTPHIERLYLEGCYRLHDIHAPIGCLRHLVCLNLSGCSRFNYFLVDKQIKLRGLDSVATLELTAYSIVDACPLHPNSNLPKFKFICKYNEPQGWSGNLEKLISFGLCACTKLESFSATICGLQHLRGLRLKGCIPEAPKNLCQLQSLEVLNLSLKEIKHLPSEICTLKHLKYLSLKSCYSLAHLPEDLNRLVCLEKLDLEDCIVLQDIPNSICKMKCLTYLYLTYCVYIKKLPEELGHLECLKELNIQGADISHLPQSIFKLKGLRIIGSRTRLESYGFTSLTEFSKYKASYYVEL